MLLAQLERSREQLLESERSLRDVQVGDLTRGMVQWCTGALCHPPKNAIFMINAYMKTGICMIKAYENWDLYDQSL